MLQASIVMTAADENYIISLFFLTIRFSFTEIVKRKMSDEETWKVFFKENPKPANFEEHVSKLKDSIQRAVTKKNRLVLVTVSCCLFLLF